MLSGRAALGWGGCPLGHRLETVKVGIAPVRYLISCFLVGGLGRELLSRAAPICSSHSFDKRGGRGSFFQHHRTATSEGFVKNYRVPQNTLKQIHEHRLFKKRAEDRCCGLELQKM